MTMKLDISKIQTGQLDATSLNWISKFAQALESQNGTVLKLRSANLLQQIVNHSKLNHTAELQEIYRALTLSLRAQVKREPASFEQALVDSPKETSDQATTYL